MRETAKTIDAEERSPLTEEMIIQLPDSGETMETPAQVTPEQLRELKLTMTRAEVLAFLGDTQDIGSGNYVYVYEVDQAYLLRIPFAGDEAWLGITGAELSKALAPIAENEAWIGNESVPHESLGGRLLSAREKSG